MAGASTTNVSSHPGRGGSVLLTAATAMLAVVRRVWHAVASLAEDLSDAGHGPRGWQEGSEVPNPYAGMGPIPPDDEHPDEERSR
jgi:hypothetical protein